MLPLITIALLIASSILATVLFFVPVPEAAIRPEDLKAQLAASGLALGWYMSAAVLFLLGLRDFNPAVRRSYFIFCAAITCVGVSAIGLPVAVYVAAAFGSSSTGLVDVAAAVPSLISVLLFYIGIRQIARTIGQQHWLMSPYLVLAIGAGISVGAWLLPTPQATEIATTTGHSLAIVEAFHAFELAMCLLVIALIALLSKHISLLFQRGFKWIAIFAAADVAVLVQLIVYETAWVPPEALYNTVIIAALYLLPAILLRAGYVFSRMYAYPKKAKTHVQPSIVEIITYTASLVTKPADIDSALNGLREVTSKLKPNAALGPQDQSRLKKVYLDIEQYIITREPVLKLTQQTLRQRIRLHFNLDELRL